MSSTVKKCSAKASTVDQGLDPNRKISVFLSGLFHAVVPSSSTNAIPFDLLTNGLEILQDALNIGEWSKSHWAS